MLKVALLGAGRIGNVHARAIASHTGSHLVAVADINSAAANDLASSYGASVRPMGDIIADRAIDAVLIATSTDTHSEMIEKATAAGKAVMCEKPVDLSPDRARACQANTAGSGQPVMVGFNRRFDPNFAALKTEADKGDLGKKQLLSIHSFDPAPPPLSYIKVSGGLFRDMMIHDFDMANFIMGDLPESISAVGSSIVDPAIGSAGDVDTAVATLSYADGRIAVIQNSRQAVYGYDQRVELLLSEGMLQVNNVTENTVVKSTTQGVTSAKPTYFFLERYMSAYEIEWAAFVDSVIAGTELPVSLEDGVNALALAEAASRSVELSRPVKLAEI